MSESLASGVWKRGLQVLARYAPGGGTLRVRLHRLRGVSIGDGTFIGTDALIETSNPHLVSIGCEVSIGIRSMIIAHFRAPERENRSRVRIEDKAFVGPGAIILPNVTIGYGAVVAAGSVVTKSVPPMTMVQGNPAEPVGYCGVPLGVRTPAAEFLRKLRPLER